MSDDNMLLGNTLGSGLLGGPQLDEDKITYEELLGSNVEIHKKIVVINSTKYTDEAFDYLLDIVDKNEAIAFIPDERQIYTQGTWFGGDVWEDTLETFSKFIVIDNEGNVSGSVVASSIKDVLEIQGGGGIEVRVEYDAFNDINRLHIDYKLGTIVDDSSIITLSTDEKLSLKTDNGKISLKKYEGKGVELGETMVLEYDTPRANIGIPVSIKDESLISAIQPSTNILTVVSYDAEARMIYALIPTNTDTTIFLNYVYDGIASSVSVEQKWGYKWYYGYINPTVDQFDSLANAIENTFEEKTISFTIPEGRYGWVAYPKEYDLQFIDADTGIGGGWIKMSTYVKYSKRIEYQVYRTTNAGLGDVRWKLSIKK